MKWSMFWLVVVVLAAIAVASFFLSYWPVGIGLAIVVVALLISRALQARGPRPSE